MKKDTTAKKIIKIVSSGRTIEYINRCINLFILPYFTWAGIKIKGQYKYRIRDLNNGLKEHPQNYLGDSDVLEVIESYLSEKKDQSHQPETYKIGGQWEEILKSVHQELRMELERKNVEKVKLILSDFGRNKISLGLSLFGSLPNNFLDKVRLVNSMNKADYAWKKMTKLSENVLEYPKDVGNFFGIEVNGKLIIDPAHRLSYYAQKISNLLEEEQHPVVVEIGSGFGGIPYHLFKYFNSKCTYISFEVPEVAVITKYFLKSVFPNKKFLFYNGSKMEDINIKEYDIIFMPNYELKNLPDRCSDLIFNSDSLVEMNYSTVIEYLAQINRICKKYFMHTNHELQVRYETPAGKTKITVDLSQPQFELPKKDFKRIYRFPAILTTPGCDYGDYAYYEYLYERKK